MGAAEESGPDRLIRFMVGSNRIVNMKGPSIRKAPMSISRPKTDELIYMPPYHSIGCMQTKD